MTPQLHLREAGSGPQSALLLHGFPFSGAIWDDQLSRVPGGWRFLAPDLPGFGRSPAAGPQTMDTLADALAALLDRLGVERALVGGLSMGGYLTFAFWRRHRSRIRALLLADTRAGADSPEARRGRGEQAESVRERGTGELIESMLGRVLAERTLRDRPAVVARLRAIMEQATAPGVAAALQAMADRPDSGALLPAIDVPTLVLVGEQDALSPPAEMAELAQHIPGARFRRIPGAGHVSCLEAGDRFAAELNAFLASLPPR